MLLDYKGASLLFVNVLYILLPLMMALLHDFKCMLSMQQFRLSQTKLSDS